MNVTERDLVAALRALRRAERLPDAESEARAVWQFLEAREQARRAKRAAFFHHALHGCPPEECQRCRR